MRHPHGQGVSFLEKTAPGTENGSCLPGWGCTDRSSNSATVLTHLGKQQTGQELGPLNPSVRPGRSSLFLLQLCPALARRNWVLVKRDARMCVHGEDRPGEEVASATSVTSRAQAHGHQLRWLSCPVPRVLMPTLAERTRGYGCPRKDYQLSWPCLLCS